MFTEYAALLPLTAGYAADRRVDFVQPTGKADGPAAEGGFLPAQDRSYFGDLAAEADRKLFRAVVTKEVKLTSLVVTDPRHVLSRLLPEVKSTSYNLRPRAHCFVLPTKDTRNFL